MDLDSGKRSEGFKEVTLLISDRIGSRGLEARRRMIIIEFKNAQIKKRYSHELDIYRWRPIFIKQKKNINYEKTLNSF